GLAAAGVTFGIGKLIGVAIARRRARAGSRHDRSPLRGRASLARLPWTSRATGGPDPEGRLLHRRAWWRAHARGSVGVGEIEPGARSEPSRGADRRNSSLRRPR